MINPLVWPLIPVIFGAGFIDSIAGGGGLLTVPAYLLAGLPPLITLGTNKCVSTMGTLASVTKYMIGRRMLWPVVIVGIPCSLIGSLFGAHTVSLFTPTAARKIILLALPIAAVITLLPRPTERAHSTVLTWTSPRLWLFIPPIGLLIGWYDGFFGPGTGSLLILALYGLARIPLVNSAAIGRVFNLASNLGAMATFILHGKVLFSLVLPLGISAMLGNYLGSHLALRQGDGLVRGMLMVTCSLLFAYLAWQTISSSG